MMSPIMQFQLADQHRQDMQNEAEKQRLVNSLVKYLKQSEKDVTQEMQSPVKTDELPRLRLNTSGSM